MNAPHQLIEAKNLAKPKHRVAGHDAFLQDGQTLYKLEDKKKKSSMNEIRFYQEQLDRVPGLRPFCPQFRGLFSLLDPLTNEYVSYMGMEDLTIDFSHPSVIDFKMGTKTYWYDAPELKKQYELEKGPYQHVLGFRISGMRWYHSEIDSYEIPSDRKHIMALDPTEIPSILKKFFTSGKVFRKEVIPSIIEQLKQLKKVFEEENNIFKFFCSSLLIIYEGDLTKEPKAKVRMIDFAHVLELRDEDRDYGYIFGIEKLIHILQELLL
jgi:1D-myo-inositol-tetrakisphosphate 5-kinase/inositol-polyphosphate multikinase